ncbi:hypothetical protein N7471_010459 [Penicillium samsonianum]|uniref:uncharacterized protein n=1 Tax=Penicillium samsonianum TaxID=1882272 RepID=UPI002546B7F0|nr:uncharacterized protein N7471_010459 [Penicillium samsonianum]KAJ6125966.1 hypothetical protein N7471_010459 [Penicillium samsonianum]
MPNYSINIPGFQVGYNASTSRFRMNGIPSGQREPPDSPTLQSSTPRSSLSDEGDGINSGPTDNNILSSCLEDTQRKISELQAIVGQNPAHLDLTTRLNRLSSHIKEIQDWKSLIGKDIESDYLALLYLFMWTCDRVEHFITQEQEHVTPLHELVTCLLGLDFAHKALESVRDCKPQEKLTAVSGVYHESQARVDFHCQKIENSSTARHEQNPPTGASIITRFGGGNSGVQMGLNYGTLYL